MAAWTAMTGCRVDRDRSSGYDPRLPKVRGRNEVLVFGTDHMTDSDSSSSKPNSKGKRRAVIWTSVVILAAAVATGIWWQGQQSGATVGQGSAAKQADPVGGAGAPPPPPVTVAYPVHKKIVEWDEYPGQFTP